MANKTIPDLTAGSAIGGTELFHGVQGGNSRKFTADDLRPGKGSAVASAATISLGYGSFFHVTGTTTITDIDFSANRDGLGAWLEFDGVLTLTHNGTTLNLPGQANIITAAGDRAYVVQDSSDNAHVLVYVRAAAPPVIVTPWVLDAQTFTGFGTVSTQSIFSRRVGDTKEFMGSFVCGTSTATEARMTVGATIDAAKVPSIRMCGRVMRSFATTDQHFQLMTGGQSYVTFGLYNASNDSNASKNGSSLFASGNTVYLDFKVPVTDW